MKLILPLLLFVSVATLGQDRIIYDHRDASTSWKIYMTDANGTHPHNISKNPVMDEEPAVSPDGKSFAFTSGRNGFGFQIFISDFLGLKITQISSPSFVDHSVSWSPDGTKLAFGRCNPSQTLCDVYMINTDGTNEHPICSSAQDDDTPRFSPDGQQLVFVSNRSGNYDIYKCDIATGSSVEISNPATDLYPSWAPDSQHIVFSSNRDAGSTYELYLMSSNGTTVTRLTNNTVNDVYPDFSSNGQRLTWSRAVGTHYQVFEGPLADLTQAKQLTFDVFDALAPRYHFITRKAGAFR